MFNCGNIGFGSWNVDLLTGKWKQSLRRLGGAKTSLTFLQYLFKYSQKVLIVTFVLENCNFKVNLSFLPLCHHWLFLRKCKRKQLVCIKLRSFCELFLLERMGTGDLKKIWLLTIGHFS